MVQSDLKSPHVYTCTRKKSNQSEAQKNQVYGWQKVTFNGQP